MPAIPRVSILIPVFNEAPRLPALFRSLQRVARGSEVVLVDDGSNDGSGTLLRRWAAGRKGTVRVISHRANRGKGAAVRSALEVARAPTVVLLDADLECDAGDIPRLLSALTRHPGAAVFGTRFPARRVTAFLPGPRRTSAPAGTRIANRLLTGITNLLFGARLTDMACGFKAVPADRLRALRLRADHFDLEAELTGGLLRQGVPVVEVPVRYRPRSYSEGKKIHPVDGLRILWRLLLLRLRPSLGPRRAL